MAYVSARIGRIIAIRWRSFEVGDLERARTEIAKLRWASAEPLIYLSLIPADTRTFTKDERERLLAFVTDLFSDCESVHHVIDGDGFVSSARRSIVTNLALATARPSAFHTYATLEEAMTSISRFVSIPAADLLREATEKGVAFRRRVQS